MKKLLIGLLAVLSMIFVVACGDKKATEEAKVVRFNLQSNPPQLDPQLNTDSTSGNVLGHVLEGLTTLGQDGNPIPGVAESWTTEGNVWTFKLRKDSKWHNGDSVVAGPLPAVGVPRQADCHPGRHPASIQGRAGPDQRHPAHCPVCLRPCLRLPDGLVLPHAGHPRRTALGGANRGGRRPGRL